MGGPEAEPVHICLSLTGRTGISTKRFCLPDSEGRPRHSQQHLYCRRLVDILDEVTCRDNSYQRFKNEEQRHNDDRNHRESSSPPGTECPKERTAEHGKSKEPLSADRRQTQVRGPRVRAKIHNKTIDEVEPHQRQERRLKTSERTDSESSFTSEGAAEEGKQQPRRSSLAQRAKKTAAVPLQ